LTTSGSSTPVSCTLVPVSPFVERTGAGAGAIGLRAVSSAAPDENCDAVPSSA
jgi:hypothetical protein